MLHFAKQGDYAFIKLVILCRKRKKERNDMHYGSRGKSEVIFGQREREKWTAKMFLKIFQLISMIDAKRRRKRKLSK